MPLEDLFREIFREEARKIAELFKQELGERRGPVRAPVRPHQLLSIKQVAGLMGVEPATVRGYISSGILKASKPRGRWMIRPEDFDAFVAARSSEKPNSEAQLSLLMRKVQAL